MSETMKDKLCNGIFIVCGIAVLVASILLVGGAPISSIQAFSTIICMVGIFLVFIYAFACELKGNHDKVMHMVNGIENRSYDVFDSVRRLEVRATEIKAALATIEKTQTTVATQNPAEREGK